GCVGIDTLDRSKSRVFVFRNDRRRVRIVSRRENDSAPTKKVADSLRRIRPRTDDASALVSQQLLHWTAARDLPAEAKEARLQGRDVGLRSWHDVVHAGDTI